MPRPVDPDEMRRRHLLKALAAGVLPASWGATSKADILGGRPARLPPGQSIYRLAGDVAINGTPATARTVISAADTIETGRNGVIIFVVGSNSYLLRSNSQLRLGGSGSGDGLVTTGLRLLTGKLLSVFGKAHRTIRLETLTATIGIRGTGVYVEADPEQTYFCTCYGIADIQASSDPTSILTVTTTHHESPVYVLDNPKAPGRNIRPAPFISHTDQELMLIETLVGRTPPFVFPGSAYETPRRDY